jgi:hypothetical protein
MYLLERESLVSTLTAQNHAPSGPAASSFARLPLHQPAPGTSLDKPCNQRCLIPVQAIERFPLTPPRNGITEAADRFTWDCHVHASMVLVRPLRFEPIPPRPAPPDWQALPSSVALSPQRGAKLAGPRRCRGLATARPRRLAAIVGRGVPPDHGPRACKGRACDRVGKRAGAFPDDPGA